jgi:pimeloyl-ACP methyl ester carboxylesterase
VIRRLGRAFLALVGLAVALSLAGAVYQIAGTWGDARRYPQRGRSVQAGPVKLNLDCSGQRSDPRTPAVILESGMGVPALGWLKVQPEIARFARVCSYDRAGYGWSDPGPSPRTSLQIVRELKALLDAAGERPPYILVGHSFGGFNVRVFASQYPRDVAGVVLVDASHEDEEERVGGVLPAKVRQQEKREEERQERLDQLLTPLLIHLGIQRLSVTAGWIHDDSLPKDLQQELLYLEQQDKFRAAVAAEDAVSVQTVAQVRAAGNLGDRPLIVLTAGKPYDPEALLSKEDMDGQRSMWIDVLQIEEARLSTRGRQIVVPDSGHMIPFERPDAVVLAVREVYGMAKM